MYANFTEETCTGTGDILTLAGFTTTNIPFSASFEDADLVAYVVEDSGSSIKCAGIGIYNSAENTISRNDTWNYDGTVVNKNPSSNIVLSTGTHTVRCDVTESTTQNNAGFTLSAMQEPFDAIPDNWIQVSDGQHNSFAENTATFTPAYYASSFEFNALQLNVSVGSSTDVVQVGICTCGLDGLPSKIIEIVTVDVTTPAKVITSLSQTYKLPAGRYFVFASTKDRTAKLWAVSNFTHAMRTGSYVYRGGTAGSIRSNFGQVVDGIIVTPLGSFSYGTDPLSNIFVLPRMV